MNHDNKFIAENENETIKSVEETTKEMCNNLNINLLEIDDSFIYLFIFGGIEVLKAYYTKTK